MYAGVVDLSRQICSSVTLEDVAVFGECFPPGRDSYLNYLVFAFVSGAVSLSDVLELNVVVILMCRFPSSPLSLTCSTSDPDCLFHQLIPVAFVVAHVVH